MQKTRGSFLNCTYERNSAKSLPNKMTGGGAIGAINASYLTMHQCIFKENRATRYGGATFIQESQSSFKNCTFEGEV